MTEEMEQNQQTTEPIILSLGRLDLLAQVKPEPVYPEVARRDGLRGHSVVEVLVDESGNVEQAEFMAGLGIVREAVMKAAMEAKFIGKLVDGVRVKMRGIMIYELRR